jgi:GntR family transcriptional repressor for pyruvate dehydrogenase complex
MRWAGEDCRWKDMTMTELKPVGKMLISDGIIEQVKRSIMTGDLKPGETLPSETTMASQLRVGRSTLREALQVLIHLGFIERKGKKTSVSPSVLDRIFPRDILQNYKAHKDIMEMIEVRKVIEAFTAESAAIRADERILQFIGHDLKEMENSIGDTKRFISSDHQFHLHIAEGAQNKIMYDLMMAIKDLLRENQELVLLKSSTILPRSMDFHRKIYMAVKGKKPKMAKKYMLDHIDDIENEMYRILVAEDTPGGSCGVMLSQGQKAGRGGCE